MCQKWRQSIILSFSVVNWIDALTRSEYKDILEVIDQKLSYIHQNPVEEGLVFRAEDYRYSSACDYAGENGMLDILIIETWYGQKY